MILIFHGYESLYSCSRILNLFFANEGKASFMLIVPHLTCITRQKLFLICSKCSSILRLDVLIKLFLWKYQTTVGDGEIRIGIPHKLKDPSSHKVFMPYSSVEL